MALQSVSEVIDAGTSDCPSYDASHPDENTKSYKPPLDSVPDDPQQYSPTSISFTFEKKKKRSQLPFHSPIGLFEKENNNTRLCGHTSTDPAVYVAVKFSLLGTTASFDSFSCARKSSNISDESTNSVE